MAYANQADMVDAFGQIEMVELTNLEDPSATTINTTALQQALDDGKAEIDSYLASRYTLPLFSTPQRLIGLNLDIARYRLDNNNPREDVRRRYEDAIRFLRDLAKGLVSLDLDENDAPTLSIDAPTYTQLDPIFSRDTLSDY